eukprot:SAG25_NODE_9282_length_379_cov_1.571429_1_plen_84_part_10
MSARVVHSRAHHHHPRPFLMTVGRAFRGAQCYPAQPSFLRGGRDVAGHSALVRVRVEIMGLIIIRTDRDFHTMLHFCAPIISTR